MITLFMHSYHFGCTMNFFGMQCLMNSYIKSLPFSGKKIHIFGKFVTFLQYNIHNTVSTHGTSLDIYFTCFTPEYHHFMRHTSTRNSVNLSLSWLWWLYAYSWTLGCYLCFLKWYTCTLHLAIKIKCRDTRSFTSSCGQETGADTISW